MIPGSLDFQAIEIFVNFSRISILNDYVTGQSPYLQKS
jgi:hypothetical protein